MRKKHLTVDDYMQGFTKKRDLKGWLQLGAYILLK